MPEEHNDGWKWFKVWCLVGVSQALILASLGVNDLQQERDQFMNECRQVHDLHFDCEYMWRQLRGRW